MDRGLVTFPHVGGFGSGRQDPDFTGQVLQWRVRNPVPEKSAGRPGPGDGHGPLWVAARGPRASQSECSPARQAPDLPGHPDFLPVLLWFRGRLAVRGVVWPDPFERSPSFLWSLRASPLTFRPHCPPLRENPAETMNLTTGLRHFGFWRPAGGSVAPQCRRAGFSLRPSRFYKMTGSLFPQAATGFVWFGFLCLCPLADSKCI